MVPRNLQTAHTSIAVTQPDWDRVCSAYPIPKEAETLGIIFSRHVNAFAITGALCRANEPQCLTSRWQCWQLPFDKVRRARQVGSEPSTAVRWPRASSAIGVRTIWSARPSTCANSIAAVMRRQRLSWRSANKCVRFFQAPFGCGMIPISRCGNRDHSHPRHHKSIDECRMSKLLQAKRGNGRQMSTEWQPPDKWSVFVKRRFARIWKRSGRTSAR